MSGNIMIPALGESISEATIAKWHKKSGDAVKADTVLLEIETDKVTLEVHAPADGILEKILIQEGAVVKVGQVVGLFEIKALTANETNLTDSSTVHDKSPIGSPAAIKIAAEAKIALSTVSGTGKDGRVTKGDMLQAVELCTQVHQPSIDNNLHEHEKSHTSFDGCDHRHETRVKMTKLRRTIAMRLKESQNVAAILTTFNEVDMSEIKRIREKYQEKFQKKHGTKLGLMSFFIKAAVQALQEFPAVNASIDGEDILYKSYYDIGVAIGTDSGLVVPVLRNADKLSFAETEKAIAFLSSKAKENKLSISDMSGGSFSITNGGIYGSMLSTPIINPPQSAILGMHSVVERPHAVAGVLEIRPIMYLALSYDHRLIDGKEAVMFLIRIKEIVENPEIILFDI